jgi:hypothetical protein
VKKQRVCNDWRSGMELKLTGNEENDTEFMDEVM